MDASARTAVPVSAPRGHVSDRLLAIQAARGVAALLVVIYHATRSLSLPQYLGTIALDNVFGFGHAGVDFFFVLSGFIITYVHHTDLGRPERLGRYTWRRLTRIYPIYWIITLVIVARDLLAPNAAERLSPMILAESLTLFPLGHEPLIPVAWTLEHELLFYCAFGLAILNRRAGRVAILVGLSLIATGQFTMTRSGIANFMTTPFHLQFLMGIAVARLVATRTIPVPHLFTGFGVLLFGLAGVLDVAGVIAVNQLVTILLYGSSSALIITGVAVAERAGSIRCGRAAELFGGASYVLYLIHPLLVGVIARAFAASGLLWRAPAWSIVLTQVVLSLMAAIIIHRMIEQPMMRWIRRLERSRLHRASVSQAGGSQAGGSAR